MEELYAVWTQPGNDADAVVEFFLEIAGYGLVVRPLEYFGDGDRVVAVIDVKLAGERANEVDRFTVRDGLIVAVEHIGDTEMLTRALGATAQVS